MRILWIAPYFPWPLNFGGSIRVFHLLRAVAERAEVDLAYLGEANEHPTPVSSLVKREMAFSLDYSRRKAQALALVSGRCAFEFTYASAELQDYLNSEGPSYDLIIVESTQMAFYELPEGPTKVLELHNIESELMRRSAEVDGLRLRAAYRRFEASRLEAAEQELMKRFDLIACCSSREQRILEQIPGLKARVLTVPNGVDLESARRPVPAPEIPPELLFVGTLNYAPNADAVTWFHDQVWPLITAKRPETRVSIVGIAPPLHIQALSRPGFEVFGFVEDVKPLFQHAAALIVPLRAGSGTRLKILEAAACKTPVVTTPIGAEGLDFNEAHALFAESPEDFAAACLEVLENPEAARLRAARAFDKTTARYDWITIGKAFSRALLHALLAPIGAL